YSCRTSKSFSTARLTRAKHDFYAGTDVRRVIHWEGITMNRPTTLVLSTTLLCLGVVSPTLAQTAKELVGTWTVVSGETVRPDGGRTPTFGDNPKGNLVFTSDGRFVYLYSRGDLPKFASNNRTTGTADENKAVVQGSIST